MNPPLNSPAPEPRVLRHDLRGSVNAIVMCAYALDETLSPQEALEFLSHIEKTSDKVIALLDQLESMNE